MMAFAAGLLFYLQRDNSLASWLCIAAAVLDFFDGWYARRFRQTTKLGAHLDPFADKVLIAVIFVSLAYTFKWAWFTFFVAIILLREVMITVYRVVRRRRMGAFTPANSLAKAKTALQCLVGSGLLLYTNVYPGAVPSHAHFIFIAMMAVLFITVDSGMRYVLPSCADGKKRSALERLGQWIFNVSAKEY
jgi:CDP-diacylglycerol--glycerol-3-phosphate 3-phosphatidyltransferase